jgi:hypothetical protein
MPNRHPAWRCEIRPGRSAPSMICSCRRKLPAVGLKSEPSRNAACGLQPPGATLLLTWATEQLAKLAGDGCRHRRTGLYRLLRLHAEPIHGTYVSDHLLIRQSPIGSARGIYDHLPGEAEEQPRGPLDGAGRQRRSGAGRRRSGRRLSRLRRPASRRASRYGCRGRYRLSASHRSRSEPARSAGAGFCSYYPFAEKSASNQGLFR